MMMIPAARSKSRLSGIFTIAFAGSAGIGSWLDPRLALTAHAEVSAFPSSQLSAFLGPELQYWLPTLTGSYDGKPTLFLAGDKDFNVPLHNSEQMYQALRSLGVPSQLVIYPGQFHGLTMPSYILDRYHRYLDWYARWLTPTKPATP